MANEPNHNYPAAVTEGGGEYKTKARALVDGSRDIALRYLPVLLQRMLDNADDTLFELADKSGSNVEQNAYFDAMRELRLKRCDLERAFKQGLLLKFDTFWTDLDAAKPTTAVEADDEADADSMVLVAEADLEESLAVTSMIAKVKNRCARELYALEARYLAIFPTYHLDIDCIAIGPKPLCEVFHDAAILFDVETKIKLIVYKLFDKYVIANLSPLYDEVNALFIDSGVLPKLKMTVKKRAGGGLLVKRDDSDVAVAELDAPISVTEQHLDDGAGYVEADSSGITATNDDVLQTLRQLLSYVGDGTTTSLTDSDAVTSTDIVAALSSIQQRSFDGHSVNAIENLSIASLKVQLSEEIQSARAGQVNAVDNNVIDIVAMLFDFVLEDQNIPSNAKVLLARLQIPLLKVAIADKTFFSQQQHPARCLLNQMAHAALGLDDGVTLDTSPLLKKIQYIVTQVLEGFNDDMGIFTDLLSQFQRFHEIELSQQAKAKALTQRRSEKREKQQLARAQVMQTIAAQINGKEIPKVIYKIIVGPWKEVMVLMYLNGGKKRAEWKKAQRFIDVLVWSVQAKVVGIEKNKLAKAARYLSKTLMDGLDSISMPKEKIAQVVRILGDCHLASFRGVNKYKKIRVKAKKKRTKSQAGQTEIERTLVMMQDQLDGMGQIEDMLSVPIVNPEDAPDNRAEEIILSTENNNSVPFIADEYWQEVKSLKLGQWLNLIDDNGGKQRAKLAWKSDLLSECTFLNWKFDLVADLSFNDLAHKFRTEKAFMIEDLPLFERAVDAVMNALRKNVSAG